jgi:hypothetical protein
LGIYIVSIGEETDSTDYDGTHVVPAEGGLIDLLQSQATTLIGVLKIDVRSNFGAGIIEAMSHRDVSELVVEVLESGVSARSFSGDDGDFRHLEN